MGLLYQRETFQIHPCQIRGDFPVLLGVKDEKERALLRRALQARIREMDRELEVETDAGFRALFAREKAEAKALIEVLKA